MKPNILWEICNNHEVYEWLGRNEKGRIITGIFIPHNKAEEINSVYEHPETGVWMLTEHKEERNLKVIEQWLLGRLEGK